MPAVSVSVNTSVIWMCELLVLDWVRLCDGILGGWDCVTVYWVGETV